MVANVEDQNNGRLCTIAALGLCIAHILSLGGVIYQDMPAGGYDEWPVDYREFLLSYGLWLSPLFVVLLSRKVCVLVGICALPILAILSARIYYAWQLYAFGINSIRPKGDWATWLTTLTGMLSVAVVAIWLLGRIGGIVGDLITLMSRKTKRGQADDVDYHRRG